MFTASASIPVDCTKEQYLTILEGLGFTHGQHDVIEELDLPLIKGKTIRINTDRSKVVQSYVINTPDL